MPQKVWIVKLIIKRTSMVQQLGGNSHQTFTN